MSRGLFFFNLLLMLVFCFLRGSMISTKSCGIQHQLALYHQLLSFFFNLLKALQTQFLVCWSSEVDVLLDSLLLV